MHRPPHEAWPLTRVLSVGSRRRAILGRWLSHAVGRRQACLGTPVPRTPTGADQKKSCGYAPHIQELINAKMGTGTYLLDKEHLPLYPEYEDNTVVMNEEEPSSVQVQEKRAKAKAEKAARMPSAEEAS